MSTPTTAAHLTDQVAATATGTTPTAPCARAEVLRQQRERLQTRHAHALTSLLDSRRDLRGVHPLADLVDDAVRWSA